MYQVSQWHTEYCLSVITAGLVDCNQIEGDQEHGHDVAQDDLAVDVVQVGDDHVDEEGDDQKHLTDNSKGCKHMFVAIIWLLLYIEALIKLKPQ